MSDPSGPRITIYARGAKNLASAIGDFVKASLAICFWILVASAGGDSPISASRDLVGCSSGPQGRGRNHGRHCLCHQERTNTTSRFSTTRPARRSSPSATDVTTDEKGRRFITSRTRPSSLSTARRGAPSCSNAKIR